MHLFEVLYSDDYPLVEATYQDIMKRIDPVYLNQEDPRGLHFPRDLLHPGKSGALGGITSIVLTDDTMTFMVPSWDGHDPKNAANFHPQPPKPREYTAKVKFLLWSALKNTPDYTPPQKARILLAYPVQGTQQVPRSDIQLSCSCPSFLYWGFQYILSHLLGNPSAAIEDEDRAPVMWPEPWRRRNWMKKGVVCKHLNRVLHVLPFYMNYLAAEIAKPGDQSHSGELPPQEKVAPQQPRAQTRQPPSQKPTQMPPANRGEEQNAFF